MSMLICKTCDNKVKVVGNDEYITRDGDIYCDRQCYARKDLKHGLRKIKLPKKKNVKIVKWMCPNCNARYSTLPRGAMCSYCKSNPRLKSGANINLVGI